MSDKVPINLVLGSGGARGLCHIGAIRVLLDEGFEIRSITGCSMGALVGALHVTGHLDSYEQWVTTLSRWDVLRFLDLSRLGRAGVVNGDKLMEELRRWLGDIEIESLPIPFTVVAADIAARKEVWISRGDLLEALRASIAVPGLFTPLIKHDRVLVDGGILNPLPIPPARLESQALTVAISLSGREVAHPFGEAGAGECPGNADGTQEDSVQEGAKREAGGDEHEGDGLARKARIEEFLEHLQSFFQRDDADAEHALRPSDAALRASSPGLTDVMLGMFNTMQDTLARHQLAGNPPDLLIDIPCNICQSHEFFKARTLIPAGAYWARRALRDQRNGRGFQG